jgi:hypothetical protein
MPKEAAGDAVAGEFRNDIEADHLVAAPGAEGDGTGIVDLREQHSLAQLVHRPAIAIGIKAAGPTL